MSTPSAINPDKLFDEDVSGFVDWVREAKPIPGQKVLTPGEPERIARADRLAHGVPLSQGTWKSIVEAGRKLGISSPPL